MSNRILIIGGGIAGLSAALELAAFGIETLVIERYPRLGGKVADYSCKAVDACVQCGVCRLDDLLGKVAETEEVAIMTRTQIHGCNRSNEDFQVALEITPAAVNSCSSCGKCLDICPVPGALVRLGTQIFIDPGLCRHYLESSCTVCKDFCPENAISFSDHEIQEECFSGIVIAGGFDPYNPAFTSRFGHGRIDGVISALELEKHLRNNNPPFAAGSKIAFVQCVGSRNHKIGADYCSRVCCGYALRCANLLHRNYGSQVTIFYMDIQTYHRFGESFVDRNQFRFIRSIPAEIRRGENGKPNVLFSGPTGRTISEAFDSVILSVGMAPTHQKLRLGDLEKPNLNSDGFIGFEGESCLTGIPGVFVAGSAQGPRTIPEVSSHARLCAAQIVEYLHGK